MKELFLNLLALGAIISSILVITAKNPIIAVLFLISVFVNAAGYLILLGIGFVGIAYLIVYVGAITVLFLFVIMLLNIRLSEIIETSTNFTKNLPLALIIGLLLIYEFLTIIPFNYIRGATDISIITILFNMLQSINNILINNIDMTNNIVYLTINPIIADTNFNNFLHIQALGQSLYTSEAILLIILSIILLLAMVAPIFISKNKENTNKDEYTKIFQIIGLFSYVLK